MPLLKRGVDGLVLARLPASERAHVEAEVLAAYDASLAVLEKLGAKLVDVKLPRSFAELGAMAGRLIGCEGYSYVGHLTDDPAQPVDPDVRPRIGLGQRRQRTRLPAAAARARAVEARLVQGALRLRCAAHPDHAHGRAARRRHRPVWHRCSRHARDQPGGRLRARRAQRLHERRTTDLAADLLPRLRRGDRAAHRLGLRAGRGMARTPSGPRAASRPLPASPRWRRRRWSARARRGTCARWRIP